MLTMRKAQKIKQIFPLTDGLFTKMSYTFPEGVTKSNLDLMFLSNYGLRNPSPVVEIIQSEYGEKLSSSELTQLAQSIEEMYKDRWDKLGEIYGIEYDPIHNFLDEWEDTSSETVDGDTSSTGSETKTFGKTVSETDTRTDNLREVVNSSMDMTSTKTDDLTKTETRDLDKTETRTDDLSESKTYGRTDTRTDNLTETHSDSNSIGDTGSGNENVYAFNSSSALGQSTSGSSNTRTETLGGTVLNTGTETTAQSGSDGRTNTGTQTMVTDDAGTITTSDEGTQTTVDERTDERTTVNTGTRTTGIQIREGGSDGTTRTGSATEDRQTDRDRSGRHFGNIGNLTSQKMILEEINLWKWNYMQEILSDVKEFCTLPVYLNASEYSLVDQQDEDD